MEQSQKGPSHPDVQKLRAQIEAMHKMSGPSPANLPTPQEALRHWVHQRTTEANAAVANKPGAQQQQLEALQKQLQALTAAQAQQAEAQQQQLRELQKAIERLATKN
jgi:hypothetical protein